MNTSLLLWKEAIVSLYFAEEIREWEARRVEDDVTSDARI
jgi:hypothetical protein